MVETVTPTTPSVLPDDIWGEIAERLDAFEVFSLSQTCKGLHAFLSGRNSWIRVLRSICRRHGVFLPTYPASNTQMTLSQIRRAASRPELWHTLMRKRASPFEPWANYPSARRNLDSHPSVTPTLAGEFLPLRHWRMHMVPGGRFLVVFSFPHFDDGTGSNLGSEGKDKDATTVALAVYDLGIPGCGVQSNPRVAASLLFKITGMKARIVDMATSGVVVRSDETVRIVLAHPSGTKRLESWTVLVFDVEFQADRDEGGSTATLKQRENSITITSPRRRVLNMSLQANSVLLRFPETVMIWGVESRRYASLKEPDLGSTTETRHRLTVPTANHIISIGVEKVAVWEIAALNWTYGGPSPHIEEASSPLVPPAIVVPDPWNHKAWDGIQFSLVNTPTVTPNRVCIDAHHYPLVNKSTVRYQIDIIPRNNKSRGLPNSTADRIHLTLVSATRFPIPRLRTDPSLACGQICYMYSGPPNDTTYAYVPRYLPGTDRTPFKIGSGQLHESSLMTPKKLEEESVLTAYVKLSGNATPQAFCALSGRMIYVQSLRDERKQNVKVVDYLP